MGAGKSGGKARVTEYYMSIHMGVCGYSSDLMLREIKIGDITAWSGAVSGGAQAITIDQPNLFGGNQKEGGVSGVAWWLPGTPDQRLPDPLCGRLGLAYDNTPGFRGFASLFFTGWRYDPGVDLSKAGNINTANYPVSATSGFKGFMWLMNNPYLKAISTRVRRVPCPLGLNTAYQEIYATDGTFIGSNPAYMLAEVLTDTTWGMGEDPLLLDLTSFQNAAVTLYNEKFGLNMLWSRQSTIEQFAQEILNHINGTLYIDPTTGKHTLKLLRGDYNTATLPHITQSNATLTSFKRKLWGEIANEVVVTYTNPTNWKSETVTAQDLAAISMQGGITSTSKNYYGITYGPLAATVAQRDVAMMGRPIATCKVTVNKSMWSQISGGVVILEWPSRGIVSAVMRITNVTTSQHTISFDLYEDIFALDQANYITVAGSQFTTPSTTPTALTTYQLGTMPAYLMTAALGVSDPSHFNYPEALSALTVGGNSDVDTGYQLETYTTNAAGATVLSNIGSKVLQGTWTLATPLVTEATSKLTSMPGLIGAYPDVGEFILIGTGTDDTTELALVTARDATGWTIARGMLDTTPKAWATGTRAFRIPSPAPVPDATVRSVGETARYKFLTETTSGTLAEADAPEVDVTLTDRAYLPTRPANVSIGGVKFGTVAMGVATSLSASWANRNRQLEVTQAYLWTDADLAGETGQTTRITVTTASGDQVYSGITGNTYDIPLAAFQGNSTGTVKVQAELSGNLSLQGHTVDVTIP